MGMDTTQYVLKNNNNRGMDKTPFVLRNIGALMRPKTVNQGKEHTFH